MTPEILQALSTFLFGEAALLDHQQYRQWLDLLTDDIVYRMPMRLTKYRKDGADVIDDMTYFEESKNSLSERVKRLYVKSAWAEDPPPRVRHFISHITAECTGENLYLVHSYFMVYRSHWADPTGETLTGERTDVIRRIDGQ